MVIFPKHKRITHLFTGDSPRNMIMKSSRERGSKKTHYLSSWNILMVYFKLFRFHNFAKRIQNGVAMDVMILTRLIPACFFSVQRNFQLPYNVILYRMYHLVFWCFSGILNWLVEWIMIKMYVRNAELHYLMFCRQPSFLTL